MPTIDVDEQVYERLMSYPKRWGETPNQVLRHLLGLGRPRRRPPIRVEDLLDAGLLKPGEVLVWNRPRLGVTHTAVVEPDGRLRLEDGRVEHCPGCAAIALAGYLISGSGVWRRATDGVPLADLWERYLTDTEARPV